jgi:heme-degrading monooxygenase HmoA
MLFNRDMRERPGRDEDDVPMFSVIFEVCPKEARFDDYLALAKRLKPVLEQVDGFVDNERFESRRRPGWILSHSTWRDEKSVVRWRTVGEHHLAQETGRSEIFRDYHLRVGDVTADTDAPREAPVREQRFDATEVGAKLATLTEITPQPGAAFGPPADLVAALGLDVSLDGLVDHDVFASIYNPGKLALLVSWSDAKAANQWMPVKTKEARTLRHRKIRIVRDYGMFDRREAPQFYPDAKGRDTRHAKPVATPPDR